MIESRRLTTTENAAAGYKARSIHFLLTLACGHHVLRTMDGIKAICGHCLADGWTY